MRILLVHAAAEMSIWDVGRGYRAALLEAGHDVRDYYLSRRLSYHLKAMGDVNRPFFGGDHAKFDRAISKQASETILVEALYHEAELVLIISGLSCHPLALQLLRQAKVRTAAILTESPYDDEHQADWCGVYPEMLVATNDAYSARTRGWLLLPPSYDPGCHQPAQPDPGLASDVLFLGTGWKERQDWLEAINWSGVRLSLRGIWPHLSADSPIWPAYDEGIIPNEQAPWHYASAAIVLNLHRQHPSAETPNPRAYELAAMGAFQITDVRAGIGDLFGDSVPQARDPQHLEMLIRYYLTHADERRALAAEARRRVAGETFSTRAAALIDAVTPVPVWAPV